MPNFRSHLTFIAQYECMTYFQLFLTQNKNKSFKALDANSAVHCNLFSSLVKNDCKG